MPVRFLVYTHFVYIRHLFYLLSAYLHSHMSSNETHSFGNVFILHCGRIIYTHALCYTRSMHSLSLLNYILGLCPWSRRNGSNEMSMWTNDPKTDTSSTLAWTALFDNLMPKSHVTSHVTLSTVTHFVLCNIYLSYLLTISSYRTCYILVFVFVPWFCQLFNQLIVKEIFQGV